METRGIVKEIKGKYVKVKVYKESACGSCNKCTESEKSTGEYEIESDILFEAGEEVIIEMDNKTIFKAGFIVYIFPLFLFFLFYFVFDMILKNKDKAVYFSFVGLFLGFVCLFFIDKIKGKDIKLKIYKI